MVQQMGAQDIFIQGFPLIKTWYIVFDMALWSVSVGYDSFL